MSLYTFPSYKKPNCDLQPEGLLIAESTNTALLSELAEVPIANITERLANNNKAYIAYMSGQPAAFGWLANEEIQIGELGHKATLPFGHKYLWNFRTLAQYRGLSIYPALLVHILKATKYSTIRYWIIHAPENNASLKGIRKAGFEHVGKLFLNDDNTVAVEQTATSKSLKKHLRQLGIQISTNASPSCWNCSSPFYKKRSDECCCIAAKLECSGPRSNRMMAQY